MYWLDSVLIRWQQVLATEVYKGLHGLSPSYIQNLFNEKKLPYNLRASKIIIQQQCNTTTHALNSLTYQGAKLWNSLPEHIKTAESVNKFQKSTLFNYAFINFIFYMFYMYYTYFNYFNCTVLYKVEDNSSHCGELMLIVCKSFIRDVDKSDYVEISGFF